MSVSGLPPIAPHLEDFTSADHLRVPRILDLQPGCRHAVRFVSAVSTFTDDAFKVTIADSLKQGSAAPQIIDVQQTGIDTGHDPANATLTLNERELVVRAANVCEFNCRSSLRRTRTRPGSAPDDPSI